MVEPGVVAVIFTSARTPDDEAGYALAAGAMESLARLQPGFLGIESVRDPVSRRGISVSYWRDEACARAWKAVREHEDVQRLGRQRWYERYDVVVATVTRAYAHLGSIDVG